MRITPPKFYTRLFKGICKPSLYQELQGDLEEEFNFNLKTLGEKKAKTIYRKEVLKMLRPSVIRKPKIVVNMFRTSLFQIHLKLAFRNLWRNKVFSAINIFGLAAAITVSMFALNIIYTGLSVDTQHPHTERLYRVISQKDSPNRAKSTTASVSPLLAEKLRDELPEIEILTQIRPYLYSERVINGNTIPLKEYTVDANFFDLFNFKTIAGDPKAVLEDDTGGYIITQELADRLFPDEDPIGKTLETNEVIGAVIENPKGISHFDFDAIRLRIKKPNYTSTELKNQFESWDYTSQDYIYLRILETVSQEQLDAKLRSIAKEVNLLMKEKDYTLDYKSQQINSIIFSENTYNSLGFGAPREFLYIMVSLIVILLLLASFNYTNLSIARAIQRTKEIGIRKVAGSTKSQIVGQILVETIVFSVAATLLGYSAYTILLCQILAFVDTGNFLFNPNTDSPLLLVFSRVLCNSWVDGRVIPALYFARISPLNAFRSHIKSKTMSLINIRKGLVVLQLTYFYVLYHRCYWRLRSLPLNNAQQLEFRARRYNKHCSSLQKTGNLLKSKFEQVPGVVGVSQFRSLPGVGTTGMTMLKRPNSTDSVFVNFSVVDIDFNKVFEPKLFAGHNFQRFSSDSTLTEVWVNRKLLSHFFNIPIDSALGHTLFCPKNNMPRLPDQLVLWKIISSIALILMK